MAKRESSADAVATALEQAGRAAALDPQEADIVNTLGVAQYRAGKHEDALTTLTLSTALSAAQNERQPADLAFVAMALWKLDRREEARTTLAALRGLLSAEPKAATIEAHGFPREAEALIEGGAPAPK